MVNNFLQRYTEARAKTLSRLISKGVIIVDPHTTYIGKDVQIGRGTVIYPLTVIEENVRIDKNCEIGPFSRLRSGSRIKDSAHIGNFVEVVRSEIGKSSKAKHLTYLGDVKLGRGVNVGAGTIVANYDGANKNKTKIDNGAFIGSGTILVAPVKVGKRAITGAGAVVTKGKNVPDGAVVVGIPARVLKKKRRH